MNRHVRMMARLVLGGVGAAIQYAGEEIVTYSNVLIAPAEVLDAGDADDEDGRGPVPSGLTGLDAETWVNDLHTYHPVDDPDFLESPCEHADCRSCWIKATGAADR